MVRGRRKDYWNFFVWYILGEVNIGCLSKVGLVLLDRGGGVVFVGMGGLVEF